MQRPGGLVDAGGHQLHIHCTGKGSPIVILEAAAGSMSAAWAWVQPEVARVTRVCSYDRAGLGWSEAGDGQYIPSRVPEELRVLLDRANEIGPIVLVGHEAGALFARMYAARFARTRRRWFSLTIRRSNRLSGPTFASAWPWLARIGVLRLSGRLPPLATGLPGDSAGAMRAFLNRPDHLTRAAQELSRMPEVEAAARGSPSTESCGDVDFHRRTRAAGHARHSRGVGAGHTGDRCDDPAGAWDRCKHDRRSLAVKQWFQWTRAA